MVYSTPSLTRLWLATESQARRLSSAVVEDILVFGPSPSPWGPKTKISLEQEHQTKARAWKALDTTGVISGNAIVIPAAETRRDFSDAEEGREFWVSRLGLVRLLAL